MPDCRPPFYARPPRPAVVEVLLNHELLAEGGIEALRIADRIVMAHRTPTGGLNSVQAVAEQIDREQLGLAGSPAVQDAARAVVAVIARTNPEES